MAPIIIIIGTVIVLLQDSHTESYLSPTIIINKRSKGKFVQISDRGEKQDIFKFSLPIWSKFKTIRCDAKSTEISPKKRVWSCEK